MHNDRINWGTSGERSLETLRKIEFERDDYVDDRINGTSIPFHDGDLQYYRSIEIPERQLSLGECELMVEYIVEKSHKLGPKFNAMKHLAYLAYNSLLDVIPASQSSSSHLQACRQVNSESDPLMVPFFHKYRHYTEDWFRTKYCSMLFFDLLTSSRARSYRLSQSVEVSRRGEDSIAIGKNTSSTTIELIREQASLYERKATIGAWAFSYLAAIKMESEGASREYNRPTKLLGQMMQVYSFEPTYTFVVPHLNRNHLDYLDEELMFIVLRGAIILENIMHDPQMGGQRELLLDLAYYSLRGHCLALMNWFNDAADTLQVPVELLFDDLNDLLLKVGLIVDARNVRVLRRVHREYVLNELPQSDMDADGDDERPSKYYMYARLFLHQYFHCFGHIHNETSIAILARIKQLCAGSLQIDSYSEVSNMAMPLIDTLASLVVGKYCGNSIK